MSEGDVYELLIKDLAGDLKPVKRLMPPPLRAAGWLIGLFAFAAILYVFPRHTPIGRGSEAGAYVMIGIVASLVTAALAAVAAFELSLPDRSGLWALLPIPSLVVWLAASGLGCLASIDLADVWGWSMMELGECLLSIALLSLPLSALLIVMLRRAAPLRPNITAFLAGLAVAAAASTLLIFVHPHDSAVLDLLAHLVAIGLVIGANVALGGRLLSPAEKSFGRP